MRIVIISDACDPPTNGITRAVAMLSSCLEHLGDQIMVISPSQFRTVPCPTQADIRLAVAPGRRLARLVDDFAPDAVHIMTEGPLGLAARRLCLRRRWAFTTMLTTKFGEQIQARLGFPPADWIWALLRWFHAPSSAVMATTPSLRAELAERGFRQIASCGHGVDTNLFRPRSEASLPYPRPIWLYVGRIAPEKSVEDFLKLDLPGTKLLVGEGPSLSSLRRRFPSAAFVGTKRGEELAYHYAASDVFVFPSRTDTFGLVVLEALASGLPVAAYPATGPLDIIGNTGAGVLSEDLEQAAREALHIDRKRCRVIAEACSWERCAGEFRAHLRMFKNRASHIGDSYGKQKEPS